jgi:hypothetical protein
MQTRKDFKATADAIRAALADSRRSRSDGRAIACGARVLAGIYAADNPAFSQSRYYAACGLSADGRLIGDRT